MNVAGGRVLSRRKSSRLVTGIVWLSAFLWIFFLARLSAENATATNQTSMGLALAVAHMLGIAAEHIPAVNRLLRALAHFAGFCILGGSLYAASWVLRPYPATPVWPGLAVGSLLAVADEVKKLWIPGRHLSWLESGLNCAGVVAGMCMALYCLGMATRWRKAAEQLLSAGR